MFHRPLEAQRSRCRHIGILILSARVTLQRRQSASRIRANASLHETRPTNGLINSQPGTPHSEEL